MKKLSLPLSDLTVFDKTKLDGIIKLLSSKNIAPTSPRYFRQKQLCEIIKFPCSPSRNVVRCRCCGLGRNSPVFVACLNPQTCSGIDQRACLEGSSPSQGSPYPSHRQGARTSGGRHTKVLLSCSRWNWNELSTVTQSSLVPKKKRTNTQPPHSARLAATGEVITHYREEV